MSELLCEKYTHDDFVGIVSPFVGDETAESVWMVYRFREPISAPTIMTADGDEVNLWEEGLKNTLTVYAPRFLDYLRNETVQYDPAVTDYVERMIQDVRSGNRRTTGGNTRTTTGGTIYNSQITTNTQNNATTETESDVTDTHNRTDTRTTSGTESATRTDNLTHSTSKQTETTSDERSARADLPNSISYSAPGSTPARGSDLPTAMSWNYLTGQAETDGKTTGSETTTGTDGGTQTTQGTTAGEDTLRMTGTIATQGTSTETQTGTSATTQAHTGTDTTTGSVTDSNNGTETTDNTGTIKERATGRSGRSVPELLKISQSFITNSNALRWLCEKLNANFEIVLEVYG